MSTLSHLLTIITNDGAIAHHLDIDVEVVRKARAAMPPKPIKANDNEVVAPPRPKPRPIAFVALAKPVPLPFMTIAAIKKAVADHYGVTIADIDGSARSAPLPIARQFAMLLAREHTNKSTATIGHYIGGRDHSTVVVAAQNAAKRALADQRAWDDLVAIRGALASLVGAQG